MTTDELLAALIAYVPRSPEETAAQTRIVAHVRAGGALFHRRRWDGHLTGSAFLLDHVGERLLLIHHRKLDKWLQPGGHGEPDEIDPTEVARREAEEETGVRGLVIHPAFPCPFDLDVHVIPARKDEAAHEHLDIRTLFLVPEGARLSADPDEINALRWFDLTEAAALPDRSVARAARKILAARRETSGPC